MQEVRNQEFKDSSEAVGNAQFLTERLLMRRTGLSSFKHLNSAVPQSSSVGLGGLLVTPEFAFASLVLGVSSDATTGDTSTH